ncbi:MAG TPA: cobaltochelatase subunit CobN [Desulfurivibrio alkaliphilus]|uniref:Cobaltochelatase subunit CobN n=1 Tax=Desulfurivibrio alkaliphilus TaxID=427923 RepID=A0A7C2XPJ0_9BACT|nr:cobaltochelatase subunit CobN [Desulfurivibrio alkaliphilus]
MKKLLIICMLLLLPASALAHEIAVLVIDNNSYLTNLAVGGMVADLKKRIKVVSAGELEPGGEPLRKEIEAARVIVVDVMGRDLEEYLTAEIDLSGKTIYALRGSHDDAALKKKGFIFDTEVADYFRHLSRQNIENMLRLVIHRHFDPAVSFAPLQPRLGLGLYHPEAPDLFSDVATFLRWQATRPGHDPQKPRLGLLFYSSFLTPGQQEPIDYLVKRLEEAGFNVLPCFGNDQQAIESFLLDDKDKARVDLLLAFSLKFYSALTPKLAEDLRKLDVPIISAISLYKDTVDEWRQSPVGIGPQEVAWTMASPEISGLIEPTVLMAKEKVVDATSGKSWYLGQPVTENIERLIPRLKGWINLQGKANRDKKIAILFYNHHQGKQNVGASYLNVFASLEEIFKGLAREGYTTGQPPSEKEVKDLVLNGARNVGTWAPGELDAMVGAGDLVLLDPAEYEQWFAELPRAFRDGVIDQWGKPGDFQMMMHQGRIVIPLVRRGNMVMMPEPARGWSDDPMKLYHDTTLYPHHQYIAAYLWLQKKFGADAMIHLGTHATYEWTPGKQAGLSPSCPPEVLITDIPNMYPYIVDDVGEAIQAKRRGRGVMLSHLTPMLRQSGLYKEYGRLAELAGEIERAEARGSVTAREKIKELRALADQTGILADLAGNSAQEIPDTELAGIIGHYMEEVKEEMIPYGMHTFGRSKESDEIDEMAKAVVTWNPDEKEHQAAERLRSSASLEMNNLLRGLSGRFVEPGEGNDPLRNPGAIPTGRNLYGFNPAKLPSPAAWELGTKAADAIIANHLEKHGKYPNKVAVVLWAVETLRNEGLNESTILWLMGVRPKWLPSGRVTGLEVVPGKELGRPRIDVLINASGLYRDLFPDKMQFLDEAVRLAILQTDIENLVAAGSRRIKTKLVADGMDEHEAEELSRLRIFSETPGSYGNGVSEMTGASGLWTDEREVVDVYEKRMGFAFGGGHWGKEARALFKEQLAATDVAVHSRSSNLYGLMDNDDMFQYLGGLAMAVRHESGQAPETLITNQQKAGRVTVEDMAATLGRELRSRYLNPKWIEGMKKEDYAGAREMSNFVEYFWGWQVTTPDKVTAAQWQQIHEVYVEDKYGQELKEFFNRANPWAYQSITARMLEAVRKEYWQADEAVQKKLAVEYAVNVVEKGVACCDHTCNNPLLNQMVVAIISLPGVLSPELVEQFKLAIEQAAQKSLAEQVVERQALQQQLTAPSSEQAGAKGEKPRDSGAAKAEQAEVEGYKMEKMENADDSTKVSSSGIEWLAGLVVLAIIALAALGMRRGERRG